MPDERQRKVQTNLRNCGNQPAHKSMPAVVESPISNFVHLLHAAVFTIDGGKDTIMPLALANEHKREPFRNNMAAAGPFEPLDVRSRPPLSCHSRVPRQGDRNYAATFGALACFIPGVHRR